MKKENIKKPGYYMPNLNQKLKQYQRDYYASKKQKKKDLYSIKDE